MPRISAIALFCEDIRQELRNKDSLVGVLPDNLDLPKVPDALVRLAIYVRIHIDPDFEFAPMSLRIVNPDGSEVDLGALDSSLVRQTIATARERGSNGVAGMISKAVIAPYPVNREGTARVMLKVGNEEMVCGVLNLKTRKDALPITSEPQP